MDVAVCERAYIGICQCPQVCIVGTRESRQRNILAIAVFGTSGDTGGGGVEKAHIAHQFSTTTFWIVKNVHAVVSRLVGGMDRLISGIVEWEPDI